MMIKKAQHCCVTKSTGYDLNGTPERGRGHSHAKDLVISALVSVSQQKILSGSSIARILKFSHPNKRVTSVCAAANETPNAKCGVYSGVGFVTYWTCDIPKNLPLLKAA